MRKITIDCSYLGSREAFHDTLAEALSFPTWYGRNLDALHDLLTGIGEETTVQFLGWNAAEAALGRYADAARKAMDHAAALNSKLTVEYC